MSFREFMQKYKAKRKRIDVNTESDEDFWCKLAMLAEKYLKKAYNAGYEECFGKGDCESDRGEK